MNTLARNDDVKLNHTARAFEYNMEGYLLFNGGNYNEAVEFLTKAIEINHLCSDAYINRFNCLVKLGKTNEAIEDFEIAFNLNPGLFIDSDQENYLVDYERDFNHYVSTGNIKEAIKQLELLFELKLDMILKTK